MRALLLFLAIATTAQAAEPSGWQFRPGSAGKPAVLLIHGLAASSKHWSNPSATWSIRDGHYDHRAKPKDHEGKKGPKLGIDAVGLSPVDKDADKEHSFWAYLGDKGYSIATWDQAPCMEPEKRPDPKCLAAAKAMKGLGMGGSMKCPDVAQKPSAACFDGDDFDSAYATAVQALAQLAAQAPGVPIALLGHSRGGLIARKLLKEKVPGSERVKWLLTLHTPHQGSSMATLGVALQKAMKDLDEFASLDALPEALRGPLKAPFKKLLPDLGEDLSGCVDALVTVTGMRGARELAANGATLQGLAAGESKPQGVRVATWGGTSAKAAEAWVWVYNAKSAVSDKWHSDPYKVLDFPNDLRLPFDEMKKGGDLLVTDDASKLAWQDKHYDHALNHAEVLWNRAVQKEVDQELQQLP